MVCITKALLGLGSWGLWLVILGCEYVSVASGSQKLTERLAEKTYRRNAVEKQTDQYKHHYTRLDDDGVPVKLEKKRDNYLYSYGSHSTDGPTFEYFGTELGVRRIAKKHALEVLGYDWSAYYTYQLEEELGEDDPIEVHYAKARYAKS